MPELDTLRGVAIPAVVFYHGFWQYDPASFPWLVRTFLEVSQWGWLGVNLFFVLSGFLIIGILLVSKSKPQYYRRFYLRRALRILPAYAYSAVACSAVTWRHRRPAHFMELCWNQLHLLIKLHDPLRRADAIRGPLKSLAVEEQFYLFWPAAVNTPSRKWLSACALAVFVASPFVRGVMFALGHTAEGGYTWLVADGLASGALLAILIRTVLSARASMKRSSALCVGVSILAMALGLPFGILSPTALLGASLRRTLFSSLFTAR